MMVVDITGKRFGRLTVISRSGSNKRGNAKWLCKCDCGNHTTVLGNKLRSGHTQSCGCLHKENFTLSHTKHGMKDDALYVVWKSMRARCNDAHSHAYKNYGGRGISVDTVWDDFGEFRNWAINNGYTHGLEIDRKDNNGDYSPENCRFVSRKENNNNKRNNVFIKYNGRIQTIAQWADELGFKYATLHFRLKHWKDVERAFTTPLKGA